MPKWFGASALNPDELIPPESQWRLQWSRLSRWHERMTRLAEKAEREELSASDFDDVIAFLQNCYHLRDWISSCRPDLQRKLDVFFQQHTELRACRDICNGFKHKRLRKASLDPDFNIYREYDHFRKPALSPVVYRVAFAVKNDLQRHSLFEFTQSCYGLWDEFVRTELTI